MGSSFYTQNPDVEHTKDLESLLEATITNVEEVKAVAEAVSGVVAEVNSSRDNAAASALAASQAQASASSAALNAQASAQYIVDGEPRRVSRRPFGLGQAAKACASVCA